jgi:hypothetical protein
VISNDQLFERKPAENGEQNLGRGVREMDVNSTVGCYVAENLEKRSASGGTEVEMKPCPLQTLFQPLHVHRHAADRRRHSSDNQ